MDEREREKKGPSFFFLSLASAQIKNQLNVKTHNDKSRRTTTRECVLLFLLFFFFFLI